MISKTKVKDILIVVSFIFPLVTRYLLLSSVDILLIRNWFGLPIYLPNLLFIYFLVFGQRRESLYKNLNSIVICQFVFCIIGICLNTFSNSFASLFCGSYYFWGIFIALFYSFTNKQIEILKPILLFVFVALVFEIFLFSFGILSYSNDIVGETFSRVNRISTTIGASTGSSIIMYLLGGILFYLYRNSKIRYFILISLLVSILMLMSRSTILSLILLIAIYEYRLIYKNFLGFCAIIFIFFILYHYGLFTPVIERTKSLSESNNFDSNRGELVMKYLKNVRDNLFWGVGLGNVYASSDFLSMYDSMNSGAPHNSYILTLLEQGVIGFFLFILFWIKYLFIIVKKNRYLFFLTLFLLLIIFNAETILITDSEYCFLITILIMLNLDINSK